MSKSIYKYVLDLQAQQTLELPRDAEFMHVGWTGGNKIMLWALVETNPGPTEAFEIFIYGTGHLIPMRQQLTYLGTVIMQGNMFPPPIWHVFRRNIPA